MGRARILMKTSLIVCVIALSTAAIGAAQEIPRYEAFVGGSFLRVHAGGGELTDLVGTPAIELQPHNMNFNLYGWDASITENANHWIGGEFDASGFYGTLNASFLFPASQALSPTPNFSKPAPVITRYQTFLFGPRISMHRAGRVNYFAHLLIGFADVHTSVNVPVIVANDLTQIASGTLKAGEGLAVSPGLGIDVRLSERMTIRPIQLDYLMTRIFGERQDNARVSAGLNFTFGTR
jgi:hypothetical protein